MNYREGYVLWYNVKLDFGSIVCANLYADNEQYFFKKNHLFNLEDLSKLTTGIEFSFEARGDYATNLRCLT